MRAFFVLQQYQFVSEIHSFRALVATVRFAVAGVAALQGASPDSEVCAGQVGQLNAWATLHARKIPQRRNGPRIEPNW